MYHKNLKDKILVVLSSFIAKHPYFILISSVLLVLISIHYTKNNLEFSTNRNDLISSHAKYHQSYQKFREEFKDFDGLIVAIEGSNKQKVKNFVEDLAFFFNSHSENFQDVFYKIDTDFFKSKKLLFLSMDDLHALENKIKTNRSFIISLIEKPGLEAFFTQVNKEISKAMVSSLITDFFGGKEKNDKKGSDNPLDLSLVVPVLEQMVSHLKGENNYSSSWKNFFIKKKGEIDEDGYLISNKKKFYYYFSRYYLFFYFTCIDIYFFKVGRC